jgi:DNA-binding FrmR family transcriptional regulator
LGRALVLEEGEACVPVLRQLVGVESAVRIDDAAGEVLTHQPEQRHRAGGVRDAQCVGHLGGVGHADVGQVGEQVLLRHA